MEALFRSQIKDLDEIFNEAIQKESQSSKILAWKTLIYKCYILKVDVWEYVQQKSLAVNSANSAVVAVNLPSKGCLNCGEEIPPTRKSTARYCSDSCKTIFNQQK